MNVQYYSYGTAMLAAFEYLLTRYPEVFVIGQGLWSPWYVGNSMTDLDKKFGIDRVIDTPVSESACTGAAIGAAICGMKPIVVHPRVDFALYAMDAIVNHIDKIERISHGEYKVPVIIRAVTADAGPFYSGITHSQDFTNMLRTAVSFPVYDPVTGEDLALAFKKAQHSGRPAIIIERKSRY